MKRSIAQLEKDYRCLAQNLGQIGFMVQGSVFERKKGPGSRYQWTWKNKNQKTQSLTLTEKEYQWLKHAVANERTLRKTLKKMRQISEQVFTRAIGR
jgi:ribosomal protein S4